MRVLVQDLHGFCVEALTKIGVGETDARIAAEVLVTTDTWGTFTHGTKALRAYVRRLRGGELEREEEPVARCVLWNGLEEPPHLVLIEELDRRNWLSFTFSAH